MSTILKSTNSQIPFDYPLLYVNSPVVKHAPNTDEEGNLVVPKEVLLPFAATEEELKHFKNLITPPCNVNVTNSYKDVIASLADFFDIQWLRLRIPSACTLLEQIRGKQMVSRCPAEVDAVMTKMASFLHRVHADGKRSALFKIGGDGYGDYNFDKPHTHYPMSKKNTSDLAKNNYKMLHDLCYERFGIVPTDIQESKKWNSYNGFYFRITFPKDV